ASAVQRSADAAPVGKQSLVEQAKPGTHGVVQRAAVDKGGHPGGGDRAVASADDGPRATEAREHKSEGERLAHAREPALHSLKEALQKLADSLTDYNDEGAKRGKEELEQLLETCGPGTLHVEHKVQVQADKLTNFHFAKLMRAAAIQARNMANACHELSKQLHDHVDGAIVAFLGKAIFSAGELLIEFLGFSIEIAEVNTLVAQIGAKCERHVKLEIPHALKPHVTSKPKFQFHINPQLSPDGRVITIPGLKLPGGHSVLPHGLSVPKGPVIGQYIA